MSIDRKKLVSKYNPLYQEIKWKAPLTIGNGSFAFTADVTGMQTLYQEQCEAEVPLLTMSEWGWHTCLPEANGGKAYSLQDVDMTEYDYHGRVVSYAVKKKKGNEEVYDWVRENPHRYNLAKIGLLYQGKAITAKQLSHIKQELDLYTGVLYSSFQIDGIAVKVTSVVHQKKDVLGFLVESEACEDGRLSVGLELPYGSPDISGSRWDVPTLHTTQVLKQEEGELALCHYNDKDTCYIQVQGDKGLLTEQSDTHAFSIWTKEPTMQFTLAFSREEERNMLSYEQCLESSKREWNYFWEQGGIVSFEGSTDERAFELERRIILSLYVSAINSCNHLPPQETGLTVNSWYGKAHLEMYLWHLAYLPLWGREWMLERSLGWFQTILPNAIENAKRNGFKGAKWPKMVGPEGIDCPSPIATLLVWQQPHILFILELLYQTNPNPALLKEYWDVVRETAEYMADFAVYHEEKQVYELVAPLIPAQECHEPTVTKNPVYEVEYWKFGLELAIKWAERLGQQVPEKWLDVASHMAEPARKDGVYLAHENCPDTFTKYAEDHPSMTAALGLLPGERIDKESMRRTLDTIYQVWNFQMMWGWDFAMMAMTETRLSNPEGAVRILLYDTEKNRYVESGNNMQVQRSDLPLYLPGNGSLLLALPLMLVGYPQCEKTCPGIPDDGTWKVSCEGIRPYPY